MKGGRQGTVIIPVRSVDRPAIENILRKTGLFKESETAVALEVLDVYLEREGQEDYQVYGAFHDDEIAGYVCFGPNTMTEGTFELYWIAVHPSFQGRGTGSLLMDRAEAEARGQGGRLMVVETSSREVYGPTRTFYQKRGYREEARVTAYYAPGDDKMIFVKNL